MKFGAANPFVTDFALSSLSTPQYRIFPIFPNHQPQLAMQSSNAHSKSLVVVFASTASFGASDHSSGRRLQMITDLEENGSRGVQSHHRC
jgi:hypothetical protein